jgi:hypothetical protein
MPTDTLRRSEWTRWAVPAAIAIAVLPLVVSAISMIVAVGADYHPSADQAWIELQVRDIGHHAVLLGPYSRFGWFHPGPLLYYLLWLPYRVTGSSGTSLVVAALVLNALTVVAIGLVARRRGGVPLTVVTLLLTGLLMAAQGAQFQREVWNPDITVLPFVLLVLLAWSTTCGEAWAFPAAVAVGSFLVQTHVGYGLVAVALVAAGLIGAAITEWRRRDPARVQGRRRAWIWAVVVTAGVVAVLWLPVVVQQLTDSPGNLSALYHFFRDHGREHSYGDAWHVIASQLSLWPDWLHGSVPRNIYSGALDLSGSAPIPVSLVVLLGATVLTWRRAKDAFRLDVVVLLTTVVAVLSVSRIVGEIFPYLLTWTWALGMLTWLAIAWSVARWWQTREQVDPRVGRIALVVAAVALVVVCVVNVVDAARAGNPDGPGSRMVAELTRDVRAAVPDGAGVIEIRAGMTPGSVWVGAGIADALEHDGIPTRVAPDLGFAYGTDRVVGDQDDVRAVILPVEPSDVAATRRDSCFRQIGKSSFVTLFLGDASCLGRSSVPATASRAQTVPSGA